MTAVNDPPTVSALSPNVVISGGPSVQVTITGTNFALGAQVTFENGSGPTPEAVVSSIGGTTILAMVTVKKGGPPRARIWDLRVTNPDGTTAVLSGALTVTP
ncbi:MAG TPA: hypothetical protein VLK65_06810 [Vicinamibacteria bacterium]|nr:hypothetical protein [Vicinamibacteria bacterium]